MDWLNALIQGVLLGGLYALFAAGLSIIFGVMRLVNIAHGDFIVVAAYVAMVTVQATGMHPLIALVLVIPMMAVLGFLVQRHLLNPTLGKDLLPPLLVTFGLSVMIQNGLLQLFTADAQRLNAGAVELSSIDLGNDLTVGTLPVIMFLSAIALIGGLEFVFLKTRLGRIFRATSDDAEIVQIMGVDRSRIYGLAMALSASVIAVAGVFLAIRTNFTPTSGSSHLLFGFEAVIIGGLGSIWGTLAGGIVLGVAQTLGTQIAPGIQILAGHLIFFFVLAVRPRGLFPRMDG